MGTRRAGPRRMVAGRMSLVLVVWLALGLACMPLATPIQTGVPDVAPEPGDSPPTPVPSATPTQLDLPTETPVIPAPAGVSDVPVAFVMAGNAFNRTSLSLLGGFRDGEWLEPEQAADFLDLSGQYRVFVLGDPEQFVRIAAVQREDGPVQFCNQPEYTLRMEEDIPLYTVGLNAGWQAYPRQVEKLSNHNATYLQALTDYLTANGVESPDSRIEQIVRADLDGDGTDEILLAATRFVEPTGHSVQAGDYSLVLMRKLTADGVVTQRVLGEIYTSEEALAFPPSYTLQGILDVNADGRLEVLVYRQVWEGHGTILFELRGDWLEEALRLVCGP